MATKALTIRNELDIMQLGQVFAQSGYFEDARDANKAIVKIMAGQELGIGPFASMRGIIVNRGKLELNAGLVGSLIKGSGRYNYRIIEHGTQRCELAFFENNEEVGRSAFTIQDAEQAGLLSGKNAHSWKGYPRNMLFARALTNGARWYCPDVYGGAVYTAEETGGDAELWDVVVDTETGEIAETVPFTEPQPQGGHAPADIQQEPPKVEPPSGNGDNGKSWHSRHIEAIMNNKLARNAYNAVGMLNLSGTLTDKDEVDVVLGWATKYREARANGEPEDAAAVADAWLASEIGA